MNSMCSMRVRCQKFRSYNFALGSSGRRICLSPVRAASGIAIGFRVLGSTYTCTKSTTAQALGSRGSFDFGSCWTNIPTRYVTDDLPSFDTTSPSSKVSAGQLAKRRVGVYGMTLVQNSLLPYVRQAQSDLSWTKD